jgi:hypothetical protein
VSSCWPSPGYNRCGCYGRNGTVPSNARHTAGQGDGLTAAL